MVLALFTICYLIFNIPIANAQTATPSALPTSNFPPQYPSSNLQLPTSISPTSPLYTDLLVHNMFHTFSCLTVGSSFIGQPCLTYQITKNAQGAIQGVPILSQTNLSNGALGTTTSLITALYMNPPVRTVDYLASFGDQFRVVKQVNAQVVGSGEGVLRPILALWQVSRNISYVIMTIIFVIIGLMVMFRQRINPQTVITAQAALPGLVIGLILITFSYFLAGLVSDMAFVGTNMVGYYFAAAQGKTDDPERTNLVNKISRENVLSIFSPLVGIVTQERASEALGSVWDKLGDAQGTLRIVAGLLSAHLIAPLAGGVPAALGPLSLFLGPAVSLIAIGAGAGAPTFFLGFIISFVATLALIYQMLKLLLRLLTTYLTIIFLTISAPFQFLAAALPGRQGIATAWILNMLANILVFPAVLAVFYFVAFLLGPGIVKNDYPLKISQSNYVDNNSFIVSAQTNTQITGEKTFPLLGGLDLNFINLLLAFGALMALPKIPDIVVSTIGRMGQAGQFLGQEISGGVASGRTYYGQSTGAVTEASGNIKRGIFGEYGYRFDPSTGGFEYGPVRPGVFQAIDRSASTWNPLKWRLKKP
ncbi:hypothetical protein HYS94_03390 [Candidatus Daviesbacteria bacterium]|nr:hypothetical protein [Candidatus Daviesbacteria bacterium]